MKLVSVKTDIVAVPPPYIGGMYWIFVTLRTDDGIEGVGEVYAATFHPKVMVPAIQDVFDRLLDGEDPHHVEKFFRRAYSSGFTQRPDLTMMGIVSGLEMACWDIIGKAAGKPVYELIGGRVHEKLRSYSYLYPKNANGDHDYSNIELSVDCALEYMEQGFTALKFDPAGPYTVMGGHQLSLEDMDRSETFCRRIRDAVGNCCDLLFGTHGQMTVSGAIRLARRLEQYDPLWFEEPVPPGQSEAMGRVAGQTTIPIAAGERLTTKYEFHDLLRNNGASILQMNLGRVGGILEGKKVAALAEVHYAQIAPHLYNGPVGAAASVQLATATPNFLVQESIRRWDGFHAEVLEEGLTWSDGWIIPSEKPGLGITLNREVIEAHSPYTDKRLHLSMWETPHDFKAQSDTSWKEPPAKA